MVWGFWCSGDNLGFIKFRVGGVLVFRAWGLEATYIFHGLK